MSPNFQTQRFHPASQILSLSPASHPPQASWLRGHVGQIPTQKNPMNPKSRTTAKSRTMSNSPTPQTRRPRPRLKRTGTLTYLPHPISILTSHTNRNNGKRTASQLPQEPEPLPRHPTQATPSIAPTTATPAKRTGAPSPPGTTRPATGPSRSTIPKYGVQYSFSMGSIRKAGYGSMFVGLMVHLCDAHLWGDV